MEPGMFPNISFEKYLADPCPAPSLSRGAINNLLDSPARAWWNHPKLNPQPPEQKNEAKFDIGRAAHCLLLEGGESIAVIEGFDDWRKKDAQEARDAARQEGKTPLLTTQYDIVCQMAEEAGKALSESELEITDLRKEGLSEVAVFWQEKNGIWCRVRVDWIKEDHSLILDYKTTETSVNPANFSNHINKMGYGIQSVFYKRGVKAVTKKEPEFVIMAQETEPPYFCSFHGLDLQNEDMAKQKVEWAINKWHECLTINEWPGYPKRICYAEPRPWELAEWEMRRFEGGEGNGI